MKKPSLILALLFMLAKTASPQDFAYGTVTGSEMDMKNYAKDTSAHAVVLQEFGKSRIDAVSDDNIKLRYQYHVKIKIFDDKAFYEGTVQIPLYNNSDYDSYETVEDIKGVTFYKDDNGVTQQIELENKKIYPEKVNKHLSYYKFAMPGLKKGCIIEYQYTVESPYFENLRHWQFQWDIPKVYSEYEVHIPAFWVFNASLKGKLKLTKNKGDLEPKCFEFHGAYSDCSLLDFGMADIPAFIEEDYMTSPKNFLSAINFELAEYTDLFTGAKTKLTKEWRDVDYQLKTEPDVGGQMKRKGLFKDKIAPVIAGKTDDLDKAKAVFDYIKKLYKWNNTYGIYSVDGLSKAIDTRSGSVADINLSLVAALAAAGLNSSAVLLSTRDNGVVNTLYPVLGDFDYVVASVAIGDHNYLLDATDPLLPFGMLPFRCLNDKGRVLSLDKPSYWIDLNLAQKETTSRSFDFTLQDNGKIKGTVTNYYIGYKAYEKRKEIKKFNTTDEYVEDLNARLPKFKILKADITNLDSLDKPLGEQYEVEISLFDKTSSDRLIFNPFFMDRIVKNPFKLNERSYPVDWGMPSDERFNLTMHLPAQYVVEKQPQITSVALPNNGGRFLSSYEAADNTFTFSNVIQFNKSIYSSEEYPYLKEIYNKIIQAEQAEMVFKKK